MIAFVEGSMERQFINANFKYVHVVPIQNGITWTVDMLCSQIETAFLALDYFGETFVWLDREGRVEGAADIRTQIRATLIGAGANPQNIFILVNDKMSENVILADESTIRAEFNDPTFSYVYEGRNGKRFLSEKYKAEGINYKEMVHGVKLLKKIRLSNASVNSPSVDLFMQDWTTSSLGCWWM